jgi:rhodanese-related sulfurtransferase
MKSITPETFSELLEQPNHIFDTRSEALYKHNGLAGTKYLSLEDVQAGTFPDLPKETAIYLICEHGRISGLVGMYLEAEGFSEVYNLEGGLVAWRVEKQEEGGT